MAGYGEEQEWFRLEEHYRQLRAAVSRLGVAEMSLPASGPPEEGETSEEEGAGNIVAECREFLEILLAELRRALRGDYRWVRVLPSLAASLLKHCDELEPDEQQRAFEAVTNGLLASFIDACDRDAIRRFESVYHKMPEQDAARKKAAIDDYSRGIKATHASLLEGALSDLPREAVDELVRTVCDVTTPTLKEAASARVRETLERIRHAREVAPSSPDWQECKPLPPATVFA